MFVNTNLMALNAHNNLKTIGTGKSKASERLAGGLRVNTAADDAAGLAISEKMRGQIRGLAQAESNILNAADLFTTGDGALSEINSMLIRIRELAIQSANDTNEDADREKINEECRQLLDAIDSLADVTEFNSKKILKSGEKTSETTTTTETVKMLLGNSGSVDDWNSDPFILPDGSSTAVNLMNLSTTEPYESIFTFADTNGNLITPSRMTIEDFGQALEDAYTDAGTFDDFVKNIMYVPPTFTPSEENKQIFLQTFESALNSIYGEITYPYVNGEKLKVSAEFDDNGQLCLGFVGRQDVIPHFITTGPSPDNTTAWGYGFLQSLFPAEQAAQDVTITHTETVDTWPQKELWVQSGANTAQGDLFAWNTVSVDQLNLEDTKLTPYEEALKALEKLDAASLHVNGIRGNFGAFMNRLEAAAKAVSQVGENLSAAESRIRDADMAKEMMAYTKQNVLEQAAVSMLTQANQQPESILRLLS